MALEKYSDEQIKKMSVIQLAALVLGEHKKEMTFLDLFTKVTELKKFNESQKKELVSGFYTDLNIDGRFLAQGSNVWSLKRWYPVDHTTEKALAESRKRDKEEELEEYEEPEELFEENESEEEYENKEYDDE